MATSEFHFYTHLFGNVNTALNDYVHTTAGNIASAITPVATTLMLIYVTLWGWSMMRGVIQEPILDGFQRMIKLTIIISIALSVGRYSAYISDMLWNTPDTLAGIVTSGYSGTAAGNYLDDLMEKIYDFGYAYKIKADALTSLPGVPDISLMLTAFTIWIFGILVTGYGAFLLVMAKMALAVILAVGPIFILMTMFEPTKRMFDAWIGQALNYVFMVILTAAMMNLILTVLEANLTSATGVATDPGINQAVPAIVYSIIGFLVLMQVPSIASALGGGVAISTLGAVRVAYGMATGTTKRTLSQARPINMRRSINRLKTDARIVKGAIKSITPGTRSTQGSK